MVFSSRLHREPRRVLQENRDNLWNSLYSLLPSSFVQFLIQGPISKLLDRSVNLRAWTGHPKTAATINQLSAKASDLQVVGVIVWNQFALSRCPTSQPPLLTHLRNILSSTIFLLFSFLFPLSMISKLQRSKNVSDSLSQIIHIISSLLIFLNISILQNKVSNELYHKIPSDPKGFIWFPKQTALLFQGNLLYWRNWFNKHFRKNKPGISKPGL